MIGLACVLPLLLGAVLLGGGTELSGRVAARAGLAGALATLGLVGVAWGSGGGRGRHAPRVSYRPEGMRRGGDG